MLAGIQWRAYYQWPRQPGIGTLNLMQHKELKTSALLQETGQRNTLVSWSLYIV